MKSLTEKGNTAGWFLDFHLCVLLSLLEKIQKEKDFLFAFPEGKLDFEAGIPGAPFVSLTQKLGSFVLKKAELSKTGEVGTLRLGNGGCKKRWRKTVASPEEGKG